MTPAAVAAVFGELLDGSVLVLTDAATAAWEADGLPAAAFRAVVRDWLCWAVIVGAGHVLVTAPDARVLDVVRSLVAFEDVPGAAGAVSL